MTRAENVARLVVAGVRAETLGESPFFLRAAAELAREKLPLATTLEIYHEDDGLVARIGLGHLPAREGGPV